MCCCVIHIIITSLVPSPYFSRVSSRAWYTLSAHVPKNINEFYHKSWHVMQYDKIILMIYYGDDIDGVWNASLALSIVGPGLP